MFLVNQDDLKGKQIYIILRQQAPNSIKLSSSLNPFLLYTPNYPDLKQPKFSNTLPIACNRLYSDFMEIQKLKLAAGRKGILLPNYSADIKELHQLISVYLHESPGLFTISFKDQDGDDCEILNQGTYEAAINEFFFKIILRLTKKSTPFIRIPPREAKASVFRQKSRDMAFFDIESE